MSQLNPDQQAASESFFKFLLSDDKYFVLSGGAGVGKTYTISHIEKTVMEDYATDCQLMGIPQDYNEVIFTATTNKAAEVLEKSLGKQVFTIHSLLGLKVKENFKSGKTEITATNRTKNIANTIIFIDESSMIDSTLFKFIKDCCKGSKVVFVGDHAQMAPVNEEISPIYLNVDPHNFVFLDKPVRNANSPALVDLCSQLRETVETGIFQPMQPVPGVVEYLDDQQMLDKLSEHFLEPTDTARILCYTNSRVNFFNKGIRNIRNRPDKFQVGDNLVVASAYTSGKNYISVERQVEVLSISTEPITLGYEGATSKFAGPLSYYQIEVREKTLGDIFVAKVPTNPDHFAAVLKTLSGKKDWSQYFALKNSHIDLRDKDACTVYKSQGSTYDTVFIDIGNIGTSFDPKQVARMIFVGVSRATTKVYFYGNLPGKYIGRRVA
jgi:hypothetical protein